MDLMDVVRRALPPIPWAEGEKIPWHEPAFSRRMLAEHLSQAHDLASRRAETIDRHVAWIHDTVLCGRSTRILDLGCGPGLYTSRLARRGHTCTGVDHAPASIEYAREEAGRASLACRYVLGDARETAFGEGFGLAMFLFGEINVFRREDAALLLRRARSALVPGGRLLLEPHTHDVVERAGRAGARFSTHEAGLFADRPYLQLEESFWEEAGHTATTRWWILDAATAEVSRHAQTVQAYQEGEYERLLREGGFDEIRLHASLTGGDRVGDGGLFAITAVATDGGGRPGSR